MIAGLDREHVFGLRDGFIELELLDRVEFQLDGGVLEHSAILIPYWRVLGQREKAGSLILHRVGLLHGDRRDQRLKDLRTGHDAGRQVEAYQFGPRATRVKSGVVAVGYQDRGIVAGKAEDFVDLGVDELVFQHRAFSHWCRR